MHFKKKLEVLPTILMLDSEEKLLQAAKKYFSNKNLTLIAFSTMQDAWSQLEKNLPDCIIVDISTTDTKSYLFIQRIKNNKKFRHIPWICLTTKGLTEDRIKGYKLGCNAYISKPFDPEELESIIKNTISYNHRCIEFALKSYVIVKNIRLKLTKQCGNFLTPTGELKLTLKEQMVLEKILVGKKVPEIASNLDVSTRTIEKYITKLLDKTNTTTSSELKSLPWKTILHTYRANDGNRTRE